MANIDRYRPQRDYQPPVPHQHLNPARHSKSPSRRRDVPPAAPSPPTLSSRTSPPRPHSRRSAPSPSRLDVEPPSPTGVRKQWYFTPEEINSSPSITDGLSPPEDRLRRAKGVNFIVQAGILLELPQLTLWVAGVFFHRFYMRFSMVEERGGIHHYNIAATALFLANKTEENCRKTKDIIISVAKVAQKNPKLIIDEQSKEYWRWRDSILMYEESMLEALTFDLSVDNPFNPLYSYLNDIGHLRTKAIRHAAWAFASDACLTPLPLLMEAEDIAIASIFFASIYSGIKIDDINGEPWWKAVGADEHRINQATEVMRTFYTENPLRKSENPMTSGKSPVFVLDTTRRRGETISAQLSAAATPVSAGADQDRGSTQSPPRVKPNGTASREGENAKLAPGHANGNGSTTVLTPGTKRKSEDAESNDDGPPHSPKRVKQEQNGENGVSRSSQ